MELTGRASDPTRIRVAFAMEQHLGHRTYYENLRAHVDESIFDPVWVLVDYAVDDRIRRLPIPSSVRSALAGRQAVRRGIRQSHADVLVFNTQVPAVLGGGLARSKPYIAITDVTPRQYDRIADGYGHRADRPGPVASLKHRVNRRVLCGAIYCVGWSNWVRDSLVNEYGVDVERTRVIPPGVDMDVWRCETSARNDSTFRLLFVGGEFGRKGGEQLLEAFASLPEDSDLVVVTKSVVPRMNRVRVVDDLSPNDPRLVDLYRTSDAFVLPTLAETFGIAAVEAVASGLPVVASRVGGLPDIVNHGVSGFLLEPADTAALAGAMAQLHDSSELRRRMGGAARRHAEAHFDGRLNADRLMDLVQRTADERHPQRAT